MSKKINFDVVIPAHNAAKTIVDAVQSALQQTYKPKAVIVIADACNDDTAELARAAGAQVLEIEARSVSIARNRGVGQGLSPWIAFLDADDYWYPNWLQSVKYSMNATADSALYFGQVVEHHPDGNLLASRKAPAENPHKALTDLLTRSLVTTSACVISRQVFLKLGGFATIYSHAEDWDLWLRVAEQYALQQVPGWQVEYRLSPLSAMRNPQLFHQARTQSLAICEQCLQRNNLSITLKNQALAYVLKMSAERFLNHGFIVEARKDLHQAIHLTPWDKRLWAMTALSVLSQRERQRVLALRQGLRKHLQNIRQLMSPSDNKLG